MKAVKVSDTLYKKAERMSKVYKVKVEDLIPQALQQGLSALSERTVLELYRDRKITLQKAAEMLSIDIWEMIEKIKKADLHIDYSSEELAEDLR